MKKIIPIMIFLVITGCTNKVTITTIPTDSQIRLNNVTYNSPVSLELKKGEYNIIVTKDGFIPLERTVNVNRNSRLFDLILKPEQAVLDIVTIPNNSTIFLDKTKIISQYTEVFEGEYTLNISSPNHKTVNTKIVLKKNKSNVIRLRLERGIKLKISDKYNGEREGKEIDFMLGNNYYSLEEINKAYIPVKQAAKITVLNMKEIIDVIEIPEGVEEFNYEVTSYNNFTRNLDLFLNKNDSDAKKFLLAIGSSKFSPYENIYNQYLNELMIEYNIDNIIKLTKNGFSTYYTAYDKNENSGPLLLTLRKRKLEDFKKLINLGLDFQGNNIAEIFKEKNYEYLKYYISKLKPGEVNREITIIEDSGYTKLTTYLIFYAEFNKEALDYLIEQGANINLIKKVSYGLNPATSSYDLTSIELLNGKYNFIRTFIDNGPKPR